MLFGIGHYSLLTRALELIPTYLIFVILFTPKLRLLEILGQQMRNSADKIHANSFVVFETNISWKSPLHSPITFLTTCTPECKLLKTLSLAWWSMHSPDLSLGCEVHWFLALPNIGTFVCKNSALLRSGRVSACIRATIGHTERTCAWLPRAA